MARGGEALAALISVADFEGDGDAAEASTALIITVNRQHDATVKEAAPDAAEPGCEAMTVRVKAVLGGIQITHGFK
jgi:hypothetical protein